MLNIRERAYVPRPNTFSLGSGFVGAELETRAASATSGEGNAMEMQTMRLHDWEEA